MVNFSKSYPFLIFGIGVIFNNLLGLFASVYLYFFNPKLWEENLLGTILFLSFLFNFIAILLSQRYWAHATSDRRIHFAPIKLMSVFYILYSFLAFLAVQALLQFPIIGVGGVNLLFIFGLGLGIIILFYPLKICPQKIYTWASTRKRIGRTGLRFIVGFFMVFYCFIIFLRLLQSQHFVAYILGYVISMNVITIALWTLTINTLNIWITPRTWSVKKRVLYAILCLFITIMAFSPTYRVMTVSPQIDRQFQDTFGENWNIFPPSVQETFLPAMCSVSGFFYGPDYLGRANNFVWIKDQIFHNESDYQLYYDVFYPYKPVSEVGNYSTILYFVGGAYIGGKRSSAQIQCKYLASQGYVVFAFDYRVIDVNKLAVSDEMGFEIPFLPINPSYKTGNYTFNDMIYDIGEFTQFLEANPHLYGADYSRVYFYGESAGGHLAATVAYGWNNPWYAGNFSTALTPKGTLLYYPPIIAAEMFYYNHPFYTENHQIIPGTPETNPQFYYATPSYLVDNNSIPALIFHGTADDLVPIHHTDAFRKAMEVYNRTCIQVRFDAIGHGFTHDYQFQYLCLYYLERFLYLIK